ncbi:MAG: hypothetical protein IPM42_21165 [Saprospiraceae bacterium]|nr:hypothetical protein [Saprospiraceae bacterium]
MEGILNSFIFISIVLLSCGNFKKNILFENESFTMLSSKYSISDFDAVFDQLELEDGREFIHKTDSFFLLIYFDQDDFINQVEKDSAYLVYLGSKTKEEVGKKSICLLSDFTDKYFIQYYLSYFTKISKTGKIERKKELEVLKLHQKYGIKFVIEENSTEFNLKKDIEWAKEMASNIEVVFKN